MIRVSNLILLVFKGNPKTHFDMTLEVLFWDLKGIVPSPFKITTRKHSHTIRTGRFKVAATRSTTANDLNLWVRSQSHKHGCLCIANSDWVHGVGATHTIRTGRFKVVATRSTTADDLNLWVRSQSHKHGCLCTANSDWVHGVGATHDRVNKFYIK